MLKARPQQNMQKKRKPLSAIATPGANGGLSGDEGGGRYSCIVCHARSVAFMGFMPEKNAYFSDHTSRHRLPSRFHRVLHGHQDRVRRILPCQPLVVVRKSTLQELLSNEGQLFPKRLQEVRVSRLQDLSKRLLKLMQMSQQLAA